MPVFPAPGHPGPQQPQGSPGRRRWSPGGALCSATVPTSPAGPSWGVTLYTGREGAWSLGFQWDLGCWSGVWCVGAGHPDFPSLVLASPAFLSEAPTLDPSFSFSSTFCRPPPFTPSSLFGLLVLHTLISASPLASPSVCFSKPRPSLLFRLSIFLFSLSLSLSLPLLLLSISAPPIPFTVLALDSLVHLSSAS